MRKNMTESDAGGTNEKVTCDKNITASKKNDKNDNGDTMEIVNSRDGNENGNEWRRERETEGPER